VNWAIGRKLQLRECIVKFLRCLFIPIAHINQVKVGGKPFPDSLCFSEDVLESRGKRTRDGNRAIWRWIHHLGKDINLPIPRCSATAENLKFDV
jgi:hypothetical protein